MIRKSISLAVLCMVCGAASATPIQFADNGHWYEYVGSDVTAPDAFVLAGAASYLGMSGYLATITSVAENAFVAGDVAGGALAWLGGSDAGAAVNDWTWRVGPEAGVAFTYTNWAGGEPNNCCGGEDYVHTNWGGLGFWNDHGAPGNPGQLNGYVIEYGGVVPEPQTYALMALGLVGVGAIIRRRRRA